MLPTTEIQVATAPAKSGSTQILASNIVTYPLDQLPEETIHEAKKSFLSWLGNAIGGHRHPPIGMMLNVAKQMNSSPQATLLGTAVKTDLQFAAILNGMSSSMLEFDDTLLDTILHPSAPVFPALFAWCEHKELPGKVLLEHFVLGVEAEGRIALSLGRRGHYERGWHNTGTAGTFGSAAAMGKLLGLTQKQMTYAMGIASTQPTGFREMIGTYTKSIHAGKAAANGMLSALLAKEGMTSSLQPLEAKRGYGFLLSDSFDVAFLEKPWGNDWLILKNTYKPFACGIVAHPAIDAAIRLRGLGVDASDISSITLDVHPLVFELTGKLEPKDSFQAGISVYHSVAVGLLDGKAGPGQYALERVLDENVINLRKKIKAVRSDKMNVDQTVLRAELKSGKSMEIFVEHVIGSPDNPLTEKGLKEKFRDLTAAYLSKDKQERIIQLTWRLDQQPNLHEIVELCRETRE
jgi:2-methylcitrate dehydratase PrpD